MPVFISESQIRSDNTDIIAGAAVQMFEDEVHSTPGVLVHRNNARTEANKLFRRSSTNNTVNAVPYLTGYVTDCYGGSFINRAAGDFLFKIRRHSDNADESSLATVPTDAVGKAVWNYTIANNHTAFNRYKTAKDTVDNPSNPPMSILAAEVFGNEAAGVLGNAPYPAYPKTVAVAGNGFAPGKEPLSAYAGQFGVNSEGWCVGTWTGDNIQAINDANFAPIGTGRRTKSLGSGTVKWKPWASEYDEGNNVLVNAGAEALLDVAGREISAAVDNWYGRYGVYNITNATLDQAATNMSDASGSNDMKLQGNLSYPPAFLTMPQAADPSVAVFIAGYADSAAQRAALSITTNTNYGFVASDVGNYGAVTQSFQWISLDPDLNFLVACTKAVLAPGMATTIQAKMIRFLPDNSHIYVTPDDPLRIKIVKLNAAGQPLINVVDTAMTTIDPETYEYTFNTAANGNDNGAYSVIITGFKDGARPADAGDVDFVVGLVDPDIHLSAIVQNAGNLDRHVIAGDTIKCILWAFNDNTGQIINMDALPKPVAEITRVTAAGVAEYLDANLVWQPAIGNTIYAHELTLDAPNKVWAKQLATNANWPIDFTVVFRAYIGKVEYHTQIMREVTGKKNQHDKYAADAPGFLGFPTR